jgi:L-alanine-DL-glutamate epimerase-like enolase superfamily enzyme
VAAIEALRPVVKQDFDRVALTRALPAGAARNALDCACWDLSAKRQGRRVHEIVGIPAPNPLTTAYTISLASVREMAAAAEHAAWRPLLKVKLGGGPRR